MKGKNTITKALIRELIKQGRGDMTIEEIDSIIHTFREEQVVSMVMFSVDLIDMDRWHHLEKVFGIELNRRVAFNIINLLYEDDIEVLDFEYFGQ